jgi:predicted site-specific integrase-resolvase
MSPTKAKLTPPEVARLWGIATEKVLAWIRSGELRAVNAATTLGGRPRYLIDVDDLAAFERSRATTVTPPTKPAKRRGDVPKYV